MGVFRPDGTFYYKLARISWDPCGGAQFSITDTAAGGRNIASVVQDMTGDGLPDVMVVRPKDNTVLWYTSQDGFQTRYIRSFGDVRGIVL